MNETAPPAAPPPPFTIADFLGNTANWLSIAFWAFLVLLLIFLLFVQLLRVGGRFPKDSPLLGMLPDTTAVLAYFVLAILLITVGFEAAAGFLNNTVWTWLPRYSGQLLSGLVLTIELLVFSIIFGFTLAVPVGLVQVVGPPPLKWLAKGYCTVIRGTPLLIQLWLLYYGLGSLFPSIPWIRSSFIWPVLREGYFYGLLALTLSVIGYEGEIMRGAFLGVPKGELEAARAFGMSPFTMLRRIWFPRAFRLVIPTLGGEVIDQLKSTPVVSTVTVFDLYGVSSKIRQETFNVYEPLLLVALIYFILVFILSRMIAWYERRIPQKR